MRKIKDNLNADADIESNSLNLNFELESKTIIASVITAMEVRNKGENCMTGCPSYLIALIPIPTIINSNRFGIFSFLETIDDNKPIRRIIPI